MPDFTGSYGKSGTKSSSAGKFSGSFGKKTSKKKPGGKGPFGFVKNVAGDVRDIAVGAGPALVATSKAVGEDVKDLAELVTNPRPKQGQEKEPLPRTKKIVQAIGKSYADTYGPLVTGDFDKFLDNVYNDPVYIGLDALTLASLGVTAPVKAGAMLPKAVKIGILPAPRGGKILKITTPSGTTVSKPLARGELRARLQSLGAKKTDDGGVVREDKGLALPGGRQLRAPGVKAAKIERTRLTRKDANVRAQNIAFERALRKNKGQPAKVAAFLRGRFDRQALNAYAESLRASDAPTAKQTLKIIESEKVQKLFDNPTPQMKRVVDEARGLGEKQVGLIGLDPETAKAGRFRGARIAEGAKKEDGEWVGGPSIEDLESRGLDPVYFPDTSAVPHKGFAVGRGGGVGVPNKTGNMRQNKGSLQAAGQLILDPATLNESFLRSAKYAHYNDVHDSLLSMAKPVDFPEGDMVLIRKKRGERVAPKDRMRSDFEDWAASHLDDKNEYKGKDAGLTTSSFDDAAQTPEGKYLAVPKQVANALAGEFTRQNQFFYWMNRNPMRVWRALVLGLRPAYLVNNAIGNTLMYIAHSARPEDMRQLAGAFRQFAKKSEGKEIDRLLEKHFAGQVRGGFVASQMPEFAPGGTTKKVATSIVNAIPGLDKRWEQALRRAKVKAELKRHPELKKHAERMGRENAYFEKIAPLLDDVGDEGGVRVADGATLSDVVESMGAKRSFYDEGRQIRKGKNGRPESVVSKYAILDESTAQPVEFAYRAISEEEWQNAVKNGYLKSDGRMNLSSAEGTVAALEDPSYYLPGKLNSSKPGVYKARIVKLRLGDGWRLDTDGYVKTDKQIPLDEVDMVSPLLKGTRGTRLTRGGQEVPEMPDFQPEPRKTQASGQDIVTQVYDRVNDALGNYDSMSAVERGAIRNLFPFYAWYKAITVIAMKLTIEQPLKVNLIAQLGKIATEANMEKAGFNREDVPSSLLGFIPTKREGKRVRGFNTSSVNPYATIGQLADFAVSPLDGPGAIGSKLPGANPLLLEIISYIYGQNAAGYGVPDVPGVGVIDALPQTRIAGAAERQFGKDIPLVKPAPDGDTFNDRDVVDELLRFLGVPYARVSPSAAKRVVER
jgi:hypothetical protein